MSIIRIANREGDQYVRITRHALQDERLSFEARGLLCYLLSKPDDWTVRIVELAKASPNAKRDKVSKILGELEDYGYCVVVKVRTDQGNFDGVERIIYESPVSTANGFTGYGNAGYGNAGNGDTGSGKTGTTNKRDNKRKREQTKELQTSDVSLSGDCVPDVDLPKVVLDSAFREDAEGLCQLLKELIVRNGHREPKVGKRWIQEMDLLMRVDGRTPAEVEEVLRWSQDNSFWHRNILSAPKFREKFDTLLASMLNKPAGYNSQLSDW